MINLSNFLNQSPLSILQWNCRGFRNKLSFISDLSHIDIFYRNHCYFFIYLSIFLDLMFSRRMFLSSNQRGICMYIRQNLVFEPLDTSLISHPSVEIQGIKIRINLKSVFFFTFLIFINIQIRKKTSSNIFKKTFNLFDKDSFVLLVDDFNAHYQTVEPMMVRVRSWPGLLRILTSLFLMMVLPFFFHRRNVTCQLSI